MNKNNKNMSKLILIINVENFLGTFSSHFRRYSVFEENIFGIFKNIFEVWDSISYFRQPNLILIVFKHPYFEHHPMGLLIFYYNQPIRNKLFRFYQKCFFF